MDSVNSFQNDLLFSAVVGAGFTSQQFTTANKKKSEVVKNK